jgi:LPXTG-site transpeptidase (sortase) family protein
MLRRLLAGTGRTFITIGVLMLLFVAFQLWGTGFQYNAGQDAVCREFNKDLVAQGKAERSCDDESANLDEFSPDKLGAAPLSGGGIPDETALVDPTAGTDPTTETTSAPTEPAPSTNATTEASTTTRPPTVVSPPVSTKPRVKVTIATSTTAQTTPPASAPADDTPVTTLPKVKAGRTQMQRPRSGKSLGQMVIPRLKKRIGFVEGAGVEDLKTGPGHYKTMPLPGEPGNVGIACHRTTYGAPCFNADLLQAGDPIFFDTVYGKFRYNVTETFIVGPKDNRVLAQPSDGARILTITTCHPKYTARQRLVVRAELVGEAVDTDLYFQPEVAPTPTTKPAPVTTTTIDVLTFDTTVNNTVANTEAPPIATEAIDTVGADSVPDSAPIGDTSPTSVYLGSAQAPSTTTPEAAALIVEGANASGSGPIWQFGWLKGARSFWLTTLLWAMVCALIWFVAWLIARSRRRLARSIIYVGGFLILFSPALFLCFQNLTHLLPENV